jgi:hypothetical protein
LFTKSPLLTCFYLTVFSLLIQHADAVELPYITGGINSNTQTPWNAGLWLPTTHSTSDYFFTDIDGSYSTSDRNGNAELGADYRHLLTNQWAIGFYGFAAYNHSILGQSFYTLNPGVELLNHAWHVSWNLYVPLNSKNQSDENWVWADSVGIYDYMHFQAHDQFDQLVQATSSTGAGTDLIASYRFRKLANIQASAGLYYFDMTPHAIGYVAMLTSPTTHHVSVNLAYTHDPLTNNSVTVGFTLHFGNTQSQDTHWINENVQHNLPAMAGANTIPIKTGYRASGHDQLEHDDVWFFNTTGTAYNSSAGIQNCTYENPCSGFTSSNLLNIAEVANGAGFKDSPNIYLAPGNYNAPNLLLFEDESLIGRSSDYVRPAEGAARPIITTNQLLIDAMYDNRINAIENVAFINDGGNFSAIAVVNTQQIILDNLLIGVTNPSLVNDNYVGGLFLDHPTNVTLSNSTINANNYASNGETIGGITDAGATNLLIQNSDIHTLATDTSNNISEGLLVSADSNITINNSYFDQVANGTAVNAVNILSIPTINSNLTINNSVFNANATGDDSSANNLTLQGNSSAVINQSILNSSISSTGDNQLSIGVQLYDDAQLTMTHSAITSQAESSSGRSAATNIFLFDNSQLTLNNTNLEASGHSATVTGSTNITAENNSVATVNGGQFTTFMEGGPSSGEPSGAVALWAINDARLTVNHAHIIARSGNNETGAVVLQTQDDANATINNSTLESFFNYGNITAVNSSAVVAGNSSTIAINNSRVFEEAAGGTDTSLIVISSVGSSAVHLTNDTLTANNQMTSIDADPVYTVGVEAFNTSTIYLNKVSFDLTGDITQHTKTEGGGSVVGH